MNLVNMFEDAGDVAVFEIDNERAYEQVMDKFGHIIEWSGDFMVAPRNVFTQIEQVAHDAGGAANEITDDMFEATGLTFMGSPCTKDCSGHKAGYEWSEKRGGQNANSHSQSFNNGAAISVNAKNKQQQPAQQTKPQTAADKLRAKMADLLGPDKAKTFGLAEGSDMCKVCGQTPCNCTHITEGVEDFKARLEKRKATLTPAQKAASEKIMKKTANGRGISNKELDDFRATQNKQGVTESRLYYTVVGTVDSKLRSEFGLRKDKNGWYLKESADPKIKYSVYKAFGSPALKEYDLTANRGTAGTLTGAENPVSPVGSVPRGQQKTRR